MKNSLRYVVVACALAAVSAQAQVYKWVDEKGKVQYGDQPPDSKKASSVNVPPPPADAPKQQDWKEKDLDSKRKKIERERTEGNRDRQAEANRAGICADARRRLGTLNEQAPVYQRNDKGEKVYIEDNDRARLKAEMQRLISDNCS